MDTQNETTQTPVAKKKIWIYVGIAIFVFFLFGAKSFYSSMVSMQESLRSLDSQIGNMYQRRAELIPQVAGAIKAAANYEGGTLAKVTELRGASQNLTKLETLQKEGKLSSPEFSAALMATMGGMKIMAEQYPQLQAVSGFKDLAVTVEGSENRLRTAIKDYNDNVVDYNVNLRSFPYGILLSKLFGFEYMNRTFGDSVKNIQADEKVPNTTDLLK